MGQPSEVLTAAQRDAWLQSDDATLLSQCQRTEHRVGGPGGQHRNKTDSGVRLLHLPSGAESWATERRSQHDNARMALERLRPAIAVAARCGCDLAAPSPTWRALQAAGQLRTLPRAGGARWVALATMLDALEAAAGQVSTAAQCLGLSTGQAVRLLETDRVVWQAAQACRQRHGLPTLKTQ